MTERYFLAECEARHLVPALCFGDYLFLESVGETAKGCAVMARIARQQGISPSTATRQVNRLAAAGMVTKSDAPDDDRRYEIRLTIEGRKLLDSMAEKLYAAVQTAYENISEEEQTAVFRYMEKHNSSLARLLSE